MSDNNSQESALAMNTAGVQMSTRRIVLVVRLRRLSAKNTRVLQGFSNRDAGGYRAERHNAWNRVWATHRTGFMKRPDGMLNAIGLQNPGDR